MKTTKNLLTKSGILIDKDGYRWEDNVTVIMCEDILVIGDKPHLINDFVFSGDRIISRISGWTIIL